jgi:hypothetical protein
LIKENKMLKIDHRKTLKQLYHPSPAAPALVDVPPMNFLMIDGHGKPDGLGFQQAAGTLYPLAYTLKFLVLTAGSVDFHVMPMEVRWQVNREKREFAWTMMLMQPEVVTSQRVDEARQKVLPKGDAALLDQVRFESFTEGMCVQFLHRGPYEGMDAALDKMLVFAGTQGYDVPIRSTHDIYLNDVRKTKPENLQTVMRLPVIPLESPK